jgi:hypothetical protein
MHKLPSSLLVLIAAGAIGTTAFAAPQLAPVAGLSTLAVAGRPDGAITFVAGMNGGGMMGGGMPNGGMMGGGMPNGGMMGGGMPNGGMMGGGMANGGMMGGGITDTPNGVSRYGGPPAYSNAPVSPGDARSYDGSGSSVEAAQSTKIYHCVTRHGQCAVDSSLGSLRHGASCGCLLGGPGKIQ